MTSDYLLAKAGQQSEGSKTKTEAPSSSSGPNIPVWLRDEKAGQVTIETHWPKLLANQDDLNKSFWLKSRVGVCLQTLADELPSYTNADLVIVHRVNDKGISKQELWAKRDFKANELIFAPLVSQVKDSHLTLAANASVGLPKHGRGAHPDPKQSIALDGRTKQILASPGHVDAVEHKGILFFAVSRTSEKEKCNMSLESITWSHQITINMPFKKQKTKAEWEQHELPTIPVLLNKKAIQAHTRLFVHLLDTAKPKSK